MSLIELSAVVPWFYLLQDASTKEAVFFRTRDLLAYPLDHTRSGSGVAAHDLGSLDPPAAALTGPARQ